MLDTIRAAKLQSEVLLTGPRLLLRDLMNLEEGDVLSFEYPLSKPMDLMVNGEKKYIGEMVSSGRRAAFRVSELFRDELT